MSQSVNTGSSTVVGYSNTAKPTYTYIYLRNAAAFTTAAVPAGKQWRIVSYSLTTGATDCYLARANNAGALQNYIAFVAGVATYGDNNRTAAVAGECIAIIAATEKLTYSANSATSSVNVCYIEEDA